MLTFQIPRAIITDSLGENVTGLVCRPAGRRVEHGYALDLGGGIYDM